MNIKKIEAKTVIFGHVFGANPLEVIGNKENQKTSNALNSFVTYPSLRKHDRPVTGLYARLSQNFLNEKVSQDHVVLFSVSNNGKCNIMDLSLDIDGHTFSLYIAKTYERFAYLAGYDPVSREARVISDTLHYNLLMDQPNPIISATNSYRLWRFVHSASDLLNQYIETEDPSLINLKHNDTMYRVDYGLPHDNSWEQDFLINLGIDVCIDGKSRGVIDPDVKDACVILGKYFIHDRFPTVSF